jgi:hypothetical protein
MQVKVWRDGRRVDGTVAEFVEQLRGVAERSDQRFGHMSNESALHGDFLRRAADLIEELNNRD